VRVSAATSGMSTDPAFTNPLNWRTELPVLIGRSVSLREPTALDVDALAALLSLSDATPFGLTEPPGMASAHQLIERLIGDRFNGLAFTYAVTLSTTRNVVGIVHVRQLDAAFEAAEWECTLMPAVRGTGIFIDVARLVGSFAFGSVGVRRLEARTLLENGRANGALRKLGAVQEGILRRSVRRGTEYLDQVLWSVLKEDWGEHWVSTAPRVH